MKYSQQRKQAVIETVGVNESERGGVSFQRKPLRTSAGKHRPERACNDRE